LSGCDAITAFIVLIVSLCPPTCPRIYGEAEVGLVAAPAKSLVDSCDRGTRPIREANDLLAPLADVRIPHVDAAASGGPGEQGLQVETLPLPLLVIDANALGRDRFDVRNAKHVADQKCIGEQGPTSMTRFA
jgi:hypothetical protein